MRHLNSRLVRLSGSAVLVLLALQSFPRQAAAAEAWDPYCLAVCGYSMATNCVGESAEYCGAYFAGCYTACVVY